MNKSEDYIVETMISKVEKIIREKTMTDMDASKTKNRKTISKEIIKALDEVISNED